MSFLIRDLVKWNKKKLQVKMTEEIFACNNFLVN